MKSNHRLTTLDLIRGCAVLTMILAHVTAFFYSGNGYTSFFQTFGDTVSFTTFLFVSSVVLFYILNKNAKITKEFRKKYFSRIGKLLIGYYFIAIISTLSEFSFPIGTHWISNILKIIFFVNIPGYTEFIIPFLIFSILIFILKKFFNSILKDKYLLIIISLLLYIIGQFIYFKIGNLPYEIKNYISIFTGAEGLYRFPILQYFPIFALGIFIGEYFSDKNNLQNIKPFVKLILIMLFYLVLSLNINTFVFGIPMNEITRRWPPSIEFQILSLLFPLILLIFFTKINLNNHIEKILQFLGKRPFYYYLSHLAFLQILK